MTIRREKYLQFRYYNSNAESINIILAKMSDPVREPSIDQVPIPDNTDDAEWRQSLPLELFFFRSSYFSSDIKSDPNSGGYKWAMATDFLADSATALLTVATANFAIGASTATSVKIGSEIFETTSTLVATWTIAVSNDYLIRDLSSRISNRILLRALRWASLINDLL